MLLRKNTRIDRVTSRTFLMIQDDKTSQPNLINQVTVSLNFLPSGS